VSNQIEPRPPNKSTAKPPARNTSKAFAKIKANPKGDWSIADIEAVCNQLGMICTTPTRGSHHKVSSPHIAGVLTIPHKRPIKTPYVRLFVGLVEAHIKVSRENGENHG
jgi:hypothetical protein